MERDSELHDFVKQSMVSHCDDEFAFGVPFAKNSKRFRHLRQGILSMYEWCNPTGLTKLKDRFQALAIPSNCKAR
jgi:hypothetical protein